MTGLSKKIRFALIENMNPEWKNLFDPATGEIFEGRGDRPERYHKKGG